METEFLLDFFENYFFFKEKISLRTGHKIDFNRQTIESMKNVRLHRNEIDFSNKIIVY